MPAHKGGKKNVKVGRNKVGCEAYRRENRQEKNAVLRRARADRRRQRLKAYGIRKAARAA
jgi:hypothetical protein